MPPYTPLLCGAINAIEPGQLNSEHFPVEKQNRAQCLIVLMLIFQDVFAQPENMPLLREANIGITNAARENPYQFHTAIRPYLKSEIQSLNGVNENDTAMPSSKKMVLRNYISQGHLLGLDAGKFFIKADPVFSAIAGYDANAGERLMQTSIGFRTQVQMGKKLFGEVKIESFNADYASYIDSVIAKTQVIYLIHPIKSLIFKQGSAKISGARDIVRCC